jgi:hypothetical protein
MVSTKQSRQIRRGHPSSNLLGRRRKTSSPGSTSYERTTIGLCYTKIWSCKTHHEIGVIPAKDIYFADSRIRDATYYTLHSFASMPSFPRMLRWFRVISATVRHPANAIVDLNSSKRIRIASSTPSCPLYWAYQCMIGGLEIILLTTRPQIATLLRKQKSAPSAMALKMSDPLRIPPSTAIRIWPFAIGAHCRRASNVAGTPSSWRPPWFEMSMPSTPAVIVCSTSSGDEMPLSQICILVFAFNQGMISSHSRASSKAWGPLFFPSTAPNSSWPSESRFGNDIPVGRVKLERISPKRRPRTGTSTERKSALYPASELMSALFQYPETDLRYLLSALFSSCTVMLLSFTIHICIMYGFPVPCAMTSSSGVVAYEDKTIGMPIFDAALDVASSPSLCARRCMALGLNPHGNVTLLLNISAPVSTFDTFRNMRGRILYLSYAVTFSRSLE